MQRNDLYRRLPEDFAEYVGTYGPHFSERLYKWAVGQMQVKDETSGKKKKLPMQQSLPGFKRIPKRPSRWSRSVFWYLLKVLQLLLL